MLYLHQNAIRRIVNLSALTSLTQLYLQNNQILRIEGLETLVGLKKLFVGMNEIRRVENMERLVNLTELHLERQRWASKSNIHEDEDGCLLVDESCVEALSVYKKSIDRYISERVFLWY